MKFLSNLTTRTGAWQLLAISALGLEFAALFFQYVLDLAPCIMCIYQRVAIWAIFFAGVIGSIGAKYLIARLVAFGLWGTGAIWGLLIALEHVEAQSSTMSFLFSCEFVPNFPSWAPLHEWIPALFAATGDCGDIHWQFVGYTMPQWMIINYSIYTATLAAIVVASLYHKRSL
ncbi:disulfide bond formation protein DsbB [Thalassotalea profundi]|uniref:Disulfide bond formation protein B n=1 Tax=Thalassotalea profundi TaxID=2036687 RepID=A0ABQ3IF03_9GAMM|nr:disulfide bond formation protein DsbB [Thalassotalea profundi]GHE77947.1 disulfide bond formation protein B [Thalassotalea profundi]